ncbi:cytochrome c oxidase assembly protein [Telmatospirillum sp.]|uniref:cytochrome c oxidase assembly protein n=1 Tax=Telmatospirillum sp. TaxID=2079197 RepID=UPI00284D5F08|nr:cytochrome c oxidase assembly protein [Telmatospirillum sp.]MDR3436120.1 cytochrome c oxidase assembly protein [Telmatospirillum sp.]
MNGRQRTVVFSLAVLAVMVGVVGVSVPLYSLFCKVTGAGGTPRQASGAGVVASARTVVVRFDAAVMKDMPWRFRPAQTSMTVHLGEPSLAVFTAENTSPEAITGTAAFNVMPAKAGPYVNKIQCFCFSEQRLASGEKADLPVSFYIDPAIADDPETNDVHTITLSYTFFKTHLQPDGSAATKSTSTPPSEGKS